MTAPRCTGCYAAHAAPGDTYCDTCRSSLDCTGQLGWTFTPAEPAPNRDGSPVTTHTQQMNIGDTL